MGIHPLGRVKARQPGTRHSSAVCGRREGKERERRKRLNEKHSPMAVELCSRQEVCVSPPLLTSSSDAGKNLRTAAGHKHGESSRASSSAVC